MEQGSQLRQPFQSGIETHGLAAADEYAFLDESLERYPNPAGEMLEDVTLHAPHVVRAAQNVERDKRSCADVRSEQRLNVHWRVLVLFEEGHFAGLDVVVDLAQRMDFAEPLEQPRKRGSYRRRQFRVDADDVGAALPPFGDPRLHEQVGDVGLRTVYAQDRFRREGAPHYGGADWTVPAIRRQNFGPMIRPEEWRKVLRCGSAAYSHFRFLGRMATPL